MAKLLLLCLILLMAGCIPAPTNNTISQNGDDDLSNNPQPTYPAEDEPHPGTDPYADPDIPNEQAQAARTALAQEIKQATEQARANYQAAQTAAAQEATASYQATQDAIATAKSKQNEHSEVPAEPEDPEPSESPAPQPSENPEPEPSDSPSPEPSDSPEPEPSDSPSPEPSDSPEPEPSDSPSPEPSDSPEPEPSDSPSPEPSDSPEPEPSDSPEPEPSDSPSPDPSDSPEPEIPVEVIPDPFAPAQWHLACTQGVNASYSDVPCTTNLHLGSYLDTLRGDGIKVMVIDDGIETDHEDLAANFVLSNSLNYYNNPDTETYAGDPKESLNDPKAEHIHGTMVTGIIAAVANNGIGVRGVAPNVKFFGANPIEVYGINTNILINCWDKPADIINESFGNVHMELQGSDNNKYFPYYFHNTRTAAIKKKFIVKSAGNEYIPAILSGGYYIQDPSDPLNSKKKIPVTMLGNANIDFLNNSPYIILVAALDVEGNHAYYSSPGSSVLISAFGGYGFDANNPGITTTDVQGCVRGWSATGVSTDSEFDLGRSLRGNENCNYTTLMNGTSAAAPMVSGGLALILQAAKEKYPNGDYTFRQIKDLLIRTARKVNLEEYHGEFINYPVAGYQTAPPVVTEHIWNTSWERNAAGLLYSPYYGFGVLDIKAAIDELKAHGLKSEFAGAIPDPIEKESSAVNLTIPDANAAGVISSIDIPNDIIVEQVVVQAEINHPSISELSLELYSPHDTRSVLMTLNNVLRSDYFTGESKVINTSYSTNDPLLSNAFYGEEGKGTWKFKVVDGVDNKHGTAKLIKWKLTIYGHPK